MPTPDQRTALTVPPQQVDVCFMASIAEQQEGGAGVAAALQAMAISPGRAVPVPGLLGGSVAAVVCDLDIGFQILSITGTNSPFQLMAELAISFLVPFDGLPGRTSAYFAYDAARIIANALPLLNPAKPTAFIGHSLGGAVAAVVGLFAQSQGFALQSILSIGGPKPGDAALASALSALPYARVVVPGDIVPSIPQAIPAALLLGILSVSAGDWGLYEHGGQAFTLDSTGNLTAGETEMTPAQIILAIAADTLYLHYASTYYQYAKVGFASLFNLAAFAGGYEKPWRLLGLQEQPHAANAVQSGTIPVPGNFTNQFLVQIQAADGSLQTVGTADDPPPPNWVPPLQPVPSTSNGCAC